MTGNALRSARTDLEMTQQQLAEQLGITANTVARYERGEMQIPRYIELALVGLRAQKKSAVGQELLCWINVESGYLNKRLGTADRIHIQLKTLKRPVPEDVRRLRIAIESIDTSQSPPRVTLKPVS